MVYALKTYHGWPPVACPNTYTQQYATYTHPSARLSQIYENRRQAAFFCYLLFPFLTIAYSLLERHTGKLFSSIFFLVVFFFLFFSLRCNMMEESHVQSCLFVMLFFSFIFHSCIMIFLYFILLSLLVCICVCRRGHDSTGVTGMYRA